VANLYWPNSDIILIFVSLQASVADFDEQLVAHSQRLFYQISDAGELLIDPRPLDQIRHRAIRPRIRYGISITH
jgi:hypothetical protein